MTAAMIVVTNDEGRRARLPFPTVGEARAWLARFHQVKHTQEMAKITRVVLLARRPGVAVYDQPKIMKTVDPRYDCRKPRSSYPQIMRATELVWRRDA